MSTRQQTYKIAKYNSNGDTWDNAFEDHLKEEKDIDEKFLNDEDE